jgi:hypothetical protein
MALPKETGSQRIGRALRSPAPVLDPTSGRRQGYVDAAVPARDFHQRQSAAAKMRFTASPKTPTSGPKSTVFLIPQSRSYPN